MSAVGYHVVFDAARNGSQSLVLWMLIPVFPALFVILGWALAKSDDPQAVNKGKVFMLISGCGLALSLVATASNCVEYYRVRSALNGNDYRLVEGSVTDFDPMPHGGHGIESFKVGSTSFRYGSGWGSIVFNSDWNHGYIHSGALVRIAFRNGDILRIELK